MREALQSTLGLFIGLLSTTAIAWAQAGDRSIWTPPRDISVDGGQLDSLFVLTTILTTVLFVGMVAILLVASFRDKAAAGKRAEYDRGDTKKDAVLLLAAATVIFVAVDGTLMVKSHTAINDVFWKYPDNEPDVLRVEVLAQQWAWNFRYAGADGKFNTPDDIVTLNDFRVPAGKKVACQVTSKDVLHSFFLVPCRVKKDANPGQITRQWFQTREGTEGEYQVTCAEICGFAHYKMQARFVVMEPKAYAAWEKEAAKWSQIQYDAERQDQHWGWDWRGELRN